PTVASSGWRTPPRSISRARSFTDGARQRPRSARCRGGPVARGPGGAARGRGRAERRGAAGRPGRRLRRDPARLGPPPLVRARRRRGAVRGGDRRAALARRDQGHPAAGVRLGRCRGPPGGGRVHRGADAARAARPAGHPQRRGPMTGDAIIRAENVKKLYRMGGEELWALKGISLEVQRGEFLAIMGPSGSGKSTLFNQLGALDRPTEGRVYFDGHSVFDLGESQQAWFRCNKIGYIFQTFNL